MAVLQSLRLALGEGGARHLVSRGIGFGYRRAIRPFLPEGPPARLGGVLTCYDVKAADRFVPASWLPWWMSDPTGCPSYEAALVRGLQEQVQEEDRVVVVGGGIGVTAVVAALRAGPSGRIDCFEGSRANCGFVRRTAALNAVANLSVHHAVIGSDIAVYGNASEVGTVIPSTQLPDCDVLELDCEGAEVQILREMTIRPRVLLVETHGVHGAPSPLVTSLMESLGYAVSERGWAEPRFPRTCARDDIRVLLGILRPPASGNPSRP